MATYVHVNQDCEKDARSHGTFQLLESLQRSIETTQSLTGFDYLRPTRFLKKALGRHFRLIAFAAIQGDDQIIFFLRVLSRGNNFYTEFLNGYNTPDIAQRLQPSATDIARIHTHLRQHPTPISLPPPDEHDRRWLYEVFQTEAPSAELLVLETSAWVEQLQTTRNLPLLGLYHQTLQDLVTSIDSDHNATTLNSIRIHWGPDRQYGIAYIHRPDLNRLLLLEPIRQSCDEHTILERHTPLTHDDTDLTRVAARCYPSLMVLDQSSWLAIQKDEEANLALSPEEAGLVESIHRTGAHAGFGYPLFINGRAGSGKSTMLQYLVADYIDFGPRHDGDPLPLYLTSSRDLLDRARTTVRGLLTVHHARLLSEALPESVIRRGLDRSFKVFHDFLYSLLSINVRQHLPPTCYVNYAEFRRLWTTSFGRRPGNRDISADLAWHVIRSYIKGIRSNPDDDLEPEAFDALPRRSRSVSETTYRRIYSDVWLGWYKPYSAEHGYWDDQDLAARVLHTGVASTIDCPAIFCDEAQDFTPVELDILFQLSLFSRRSLQPEELERVPIAFAGDPLQTINPTGFRWDAVKADFHERFCANLDPRRVGHSPTISYHELNYNYRSNPGIVRFCNLIQLLRAALFNDSNVRPQSAWWIDATVQTVWFTPDDHHTASQLQQQPELVKLVDCHEGNENAYVAQHPTLQLLDQEPEGVYRNVLSPTRAKGLEFSAVVVHGFGDSAPLDILRMLEEEDDELSAEARLPLEYFLNRLYVAASRAKDRLIVVDSSGSRERFWRFATDPHVLDRLISRTGRKELWEPAVATLVDGTEDAWTGAPIDQREQALEYADKGRRDRDPYLLRQAALAHRSAGDGHESGRCLAQAEEFEGRHREAGDRYRELDLADDAFRCYWKGRQWRTVIELSKDNPRLVGRLESRAAEVMVEQRPVDAAFAERLNAAADNGEWIRRATSDSTWQVVFFEVASRLAEARDPTAVSLSHTFRTFCLLADAGVGFRDAHLAALAYAAGEFTRAAEFWERSEDVSHDRYLRAKANATPFPQCVEFLERLRDHAGILERLREGNSRHEGIEGLHDSVRRAVAQAALEVGDVTLAVRTMRTGAERGQLVRLLEVATDANDQQVARAAVTLAGRQFVRTTMWADAIGVAELSFRGLLASSVRKRLRAILDRADASGAALDAVVSELAVSEDLSDGQPDAVVDFLNRYFVGGAAPKREGAGRRHGLSARVVGAAIERAGRIVDAVKYYEQLVEDSGNMPDDRRYAAERLVRNLERHAEYLRNRRDDLRRAALQESRARSLRREERIGDRVIDRYPLVEVPTDDAETVTTWHFGPFEIVRSRTHERFRIEHRELFETVTIDTVSSTLRGDAEFSQPSVTKGAVSWRIARWRVILQLTTGTDDIWVKVDYDGKVFEAPMREESRGVKR